MNASVMHYESSVESVIEIKRTNGETLDLSVECLHWEPTGLAVVLYGEDNQETCEPQLIGKVILSLDEARRLKELLIAVDLGIA